jgi:hypothetical protein
MEDLTKTVSEDAPTATAIQISQNPSLESSLHFMNVRATKKNNSISKKNLQ